MSQTYKYNNLAYNVVKAMKEQKKNFKVYATNYTLTIETETGEKMKFLHQKKKPKFFAIAKKVEKDIKEADNYINVYLHSFTMKKPEYFDVKANLIPFQAYQVFNLDINSAYPSALLAVELITRETFQALMSLPKLDRLACIGILGSRKEVFKYINGKLDEHETIEGRFRHIWKFVVNYVDSIMLELIELNRENFVFYWVDGIYLRTKPSPEKLEEIQYTIEEAGLQFKTEFLQNFSVERERQNFKIKYLKSGKQKVFEIPSKTYRNIKAEFRKELYK